MDKYKGSSVTGTGKNVVTLRYDLTCPKIRWEAGWQIDGSFTMESGERLTVDHPYDRSTGTGDELHYWDPDAQVLDRLRSVVMAQMKTTSLAVYGPRAMLMTGTVALRSSQGPCRSCRTVIKLFKAEFPMITLVVKYPAYDENPLRLAGTGGGAYGYPGATKVNGLWTVEFKPPATTGGGSSGSSGSSGSTGSTVSGSSTGTTSTATTTTTTTTMTTGKSDGKRK